ncbi:hypothetical protein DITRI_Ditri07aG0077200 [Diplodiscus trichospermus]
MFESSEVMESSLSKFKMILDGCKHAIPPFISIKVGGIFRKVHVVVEEPDAIVTVCTGYSDLIDSEKVNHLMTANDHRSLVLQNDDDCLMGYMNPNDTEEVNYVCGFNESLDVNEVGSNANDDALNLSLGTMVPLTLLARGRREERQELSETIKIGQDVAFIDSDISMSDEEIENKNVIICTEAEATWDVSSILGIVFDKNRNQMIEVFHSLEEVERKSKASME